MLGCSLGFPLARLDPYQWGWREHEYACLHLNWSLGRSGGSPALGTYTLARTNGPRSRHTSLRRRGQGHTACTANECAHAAKQNPTTTGILHEPPDTRPLVTGCHQRGPPKGSTHPDTVLRHASAELACGHDAPALLVQVLLVFVVSPSVIQPGSSWCPSRRSQPGRDPAVAAALPADGPERLHSSCGGHISHNEPEPEVG
jgi:hypothetical protein